MIPPPRDQAGFTLAEMLVALFIFGLIAASGVALLGFSIRAQAAAGERLDESATLRRLTSLLTQDLAQAAPRATRDAQGVSRPAMIGLPDGSGPVALGLVRTGWGNPDGQPRASLQRVEYRLADGRLERRAAPRLDGAELGPPAALLSDVETLSLRYRSLGAWRERWDPLRPGLLPDAIELVLRQKGGDEIRMLFLVGPGA